MFDFFSLLTTTLLHSLWQSAILVWIWKTFFNYPSSHKPKSVFKYSSDVFIIAQILISIITFIILSLHPLDVSALNIIDINFAVWVSRYQWVITFSYLLFFIFRLTLNVKGIGAYIQLSGAAKIKPSVEIRNFTSKMALQLGCKKPIHIWFSEAVSSPLTYGFIKPVILLPFSLACQLPSSSIEMLIIHELNHIRNHDFLRNILLLIAEQIYCINPFFIKLCNASRLSSEFESDEMVTRFNYNPLHYAQLLLSTAKNTFQPNFLTVQFSGPRRDLLTRIQRITGNEQHSNSKSFNYRIVSIVLLVMGLSISFSNFSHQTLSKPINISQPRLTTQNIALVNQQANWVNSITLLKDRSTSTNHALNKNQSINKRETSKNEITIVENKIASDSSFLAYPINAVSNIEQDNEHKQFIVKEEYPSKKQSITKVYELKKENGQWKAHLMSVIVEHQTSDEQEGWQ